MLSRNPVTLRKDLCIVGTGLDNNPKGDEIHDKGTLAARHTGRGWQLASLSDVGPEGWG
jgi:hypothetical protein